VAWSKDPEIAAGAAAGAAGAAGAAARAVAGVVAGDAWRMDLAASNRDPECEILPCEEENSCVPRGP
jgi:hypothetical protein